ncbi:MAG TPA: hypothetical protein ENI23_10580 [bacterium]|nr:hypothetical protein [bacterium]
MPKLGRFCKNCGKPFIWKGKGNILCYKCIAHYEKEVVERYKERLVGFAPLCGGLVLNPRRKNRD